MTKQGKQDDSAEDRTKLLEDKLQTSEGKLPHPNILSAWTNNFSNFPEFTFGNLYNYLVSKEDHSLPPLSRTNQAILLSAFLSRHRLSEYLSQIIF